MLMLYILAYQFSARASFSSQNKISQFSLNKLKKYYNVFQNGSLQLSPASQSLLKNQQIILGSTQAQVPQRMVIPKLNIKMETQMQGKILQVCEAKNMRKKIILSTRVNSNFKYGGRSISTFLMHTFYIWGKI